ncbi:MAG: dehydrogenase, partial [Rhodococcus sp.]|nr:dehydrogenase [Rhodococcus sp. (in: high G+C Gram-positive bacteria)]
MKVAQKVAIVTGGGGGIGGAMAEALADDGGR